MHAWLGILTLCLFFYDANVCFPLCLFIPFYFCSFFFFFLYNRYFCCHVLKILLPKSWKCFSILLFLTTLTEQPQGTIVWDTVYPNIPLKNGLSAGVPMCPFLQFSLSCPASSWNLCARAAPCPMFLLGSSFHHLFFHQLFSSSLSAISVLLSAYYEVTDISPWNLDFRELVLEACVSSSTSFQMTYAAYVN